MPTLDWLLSPIPDHPIGTDLSVHYHKQRSQAFDSAEMEYKHGGDQRKVGAPRFELGTSSLSATRSNQLSYAPAGGQLVFPKRRIISFPRGVSKGGPGFPENGLLFEKIEVPSEMGDSLSCKRKAIRAVWYRPETTRTPPFRCQFIST